MGSRSDQYIGLNMWAYAYVHSEPRPFTLVGVKTYQDGEQIIINEQGADSGIEFEVIEEVDGAWNEKFFALHKYTFPDGRVVTEYIQRMPWSSGPMYFLALKDESGTPIPESLWTEKELGEY